MFWFCTLFYIDAISIQNPIKLFLYYSLSRKKKFKKGLLVEKWKQSILIIFGDNLVTEWHHLKSARHPVLFDIVMQGIIWVVNVNIKDSDKIKLSDASCYLISQDYFERSHPRVVTVKKKLWFCDITMGWRDFDWVVLYLTVTISGN